MNIADCAGYFHDGSVVDIQHHGKDIEFILESCQVDNIFEERDLLSKRNTIIGKLIIKRVKEFKVSNKIFTDVLTKVYDDGEILDLRVGKNKVFLLIEWTNFPPKQSVNDVSKIEIEAEEIYWENIPDLPD